MHAVSAAEDDLRILLAMSQDERRAAVSAALAVSGHAVEAVGGVAEGRAALERVAPDVLLVEATLPEDGAAALTRAAADRGPARPWVLWLAGNGEDPAPAAAHAGADDVGAGFGENELALRLRHAERVRDLEERLARHTRRLESVQRGMERDLEAAAVMQRALLPPAKPDLPGLAAAWRFLPCSGVAGDVVGVHALDPERAAFYLLDVAGHGVPAAMLAFTLSRLLMPGRHLVAPGGGSAEGEAAGVLASPAELLAGLNDQFPDDGESTRYFTMAYGVWDAARRIARVAQAGHPAPIVQRGRAMLPLTAEGRPIGLFAKTVYDELEIELGPGDRLFLYSDGVTEARAPSGETFGNARLLDVLRGQRDHTLEQAAAAVEQAVHAWIGDGPRRDDVTFLALEAA